MKLYLLFEEYTGAIAGCAEVDVPYNLTLENHDELKAFKQEMIEIYRNRMDCNVTGQYDFEEEEENYSENL